MEIPIIFWLYEKKESSFLDQALKKQVLRTFTYGLYAVSCANEGEVNIFTANWLTQVSFDPPLLALSIERASRGRSEEHTSELQSHLNLVCRLLLEKKK